MKIRKYSKTKYLTIQSTAKLTTNPHKDQSPNISSRIDVYGMHFAWACLPLCVGAVNIVCAAVTRKTMHHLLHKQRLSTVSKCHSVKRLRFPQLSNTIHTYTIPAFQTQPSQSPKAKNLFSKRAKYQAIILQSCTNSDATIIGKIESFCPQRFHNWEQK